MSNDRYPHTAHMRWEGYDLRGGLSNRLFLSLRSGIPSEVDWALHHLLAVSHERDNEFELVKWPGSVEGLMELVEAWVTDVTSRAKERDGEAAHVLSSHDELDRERRATDAILVLRNAAHLNAENKVMIANVLARPSTYASSRTAEQIKAMVSTTTTTRKYLPSRFLLAFNEIFGTLSMDQLIRLSLHAPEPLIYLLDLFVLCMPQSCPGHPFRLPKGNTRPVHPHTIDMLQRLMLDVLPKLYINSSDLAIIVVIMQIYLHSPQAFTPSLDVLAPKLLPNLLLTPTSINGMPSPYPRNLALFSLDLLYALTVNEAAALTLLKLPDVDAWIRVILGLTGWNTKREPHSWRQPERMAGRKVPLPQVNGRSMPQIQNGGKNNAGYAVPDDDGTMSCAEPFGLGPVLKMSEQKRERLRRTPEPRRCREWITEVFAPQAQSSVTQVTFWNAYRNFATSTSQEANALGPGVSSISPALPAAEAIKNISEIYPGAVAMVVSSDEQGRQLRPPKFIIQGIRFRRSAGRRETYTCRWQDCHMPLGAVSSAELITHLETSHIAVHPKPEVCRWGTCQYRNPTLSHAATHVPGPIDDSKEPTGEDVIIHPSTPMATLRSPFLTSRLTPPLPSDVKLSYEKITTPIVPADKDNLAGECFVATVTLRNLARALRKEVQRASSGDGAFGGKTRRKLENGEVYGLPIPPGYLDSMTAEEGEIVRLTEQERERALRIFRAVVEEEALEMMSLSQLGPYMVECVGL